uniref:Transmembrane and ubiquitin-like domain containing 2 n=2 Tax=Nothobranchius korthausae TaxID=1143690 RepID=A0A1A8EUF6_9TELE
MDGLGDEVAAAGGMLLLVLALILAWLSTHVADRGDHILGTILTVGAHASLIGLGGHDNYSVGPAGADAPEQLTLTTCKTNSFHDDDEEEEVEDLKQVDKKQVKPTPVLTRTIIATTGTTTSISVRLKFLNDTEEVAVVEPHDTVEILRSKCFPGREHQIKLIFRGQLLQDPKRTLFSLNITDNSVIHCHITQSMQEASLEEGAQPGAGTGLTSGPSRGFRAAGVAVSTSSLVVPVFVVILAVVWYFRINYRQFFTAPATISLVGVTVFFSFLIFGMHSR